MLTAAFESSILTLTCGNEDNPDAAVSLYVKNGISHEKVKLSGGVFFPESLCEHCMHAARKKRLMGNLKKIQTSIMVCLFVLENIPIRNSKCMMLVTSCQTQSLGLGDTSTCRCLHAKVVKLLRMRTCFLTERADSVW